MDPVSRYIPQERNLGSKIGPIRMSKGSKVMITIRVSLLNQGHDDQVPQAEWR